MTALIPLIQELLPMILPSSVHIAKAADIHRPSLREEEEETLALEREDEEDRRGRRRSWESGRGSEPGGDQEMNGFGQNGQSRENGTNGLNGVNGERDKENESKASKPKQRNEDDDIGFGEDDNDYESDDEPPPWSRARGMTHPAERDPRSGRPRPGTGVTMRDAVVGRTGRMCASVLTVKPGCSTIVFHNGEQEAIMYAASGRATLATLPEDEDYGEETDSVVTTASRPSRNLIGPGDFAFIPAWTEHQVINESDDEDVVWVVVHSGAEPTVVPLREFGGPEARF